MIHPDTELKFISETIGYGIVATQPLPKGTIIWTLSDFDNIFSAEMVAKMGKSHQEILNKYAFINSHGDFVLGWDHDRYTNHSCNPSILFLTEMNCIAIRDLEPGDEITCDYTQFNFRGSLNCSCNDRNCRKTISIHNIFPLIQLWDESLKAAFLNLFHLEQPLWDFVKDKDELIRLKNNPNEISSSSVLTLKNLQLIRTSES